MIVVIISIAVNSKSGHASEHAAGPKAWRKPDEPNKRVPCQAQ